MKERSYEIVQRRCGLKPPPDRDGAIGLPAWAAQLKAKTAVLVHGAFADGSCWQKVIPFLEKAGLKVIAVQNARLAGERRRRHQAAKRIVHASSSA